MMSKVQPIVFSPVHAIDSKAYLGNGFIGIRPDIEPFAPALTVVAGYTQSARKPRDFEQLACAPYPFCMDVRIDGISLSTGEHEIEEQRLDMASGELVTAMRFAQVRFLITQFISRTNPTLCLQETELRALEDVQVELLPGCDFTQVDGTFAPYLVYDGKRTMEEQVYCGGDDRARLGISMTTRLASEGESILPEERGKYVLALKKGQCAVFWIITSLVSEFYQTDCHLEAKRQTSLAWMIGFDALRARNRACWSDVWKGRMVIRGQEECVGLAQRGLDVALYGVMSSCHPQGMTGVPPFGLSKHRDYGGHIFWDMDTWISYALQMLNPECVRAMVDYRVRCMPAARKHAARYGYAGIQYPWEAGVHGEDATPADADTGWGEHHITPDVATMVWEYCLASGDEEYAKEKAWPLLREVARWIVSRGTFTARGFEICDVVGVDEFSSAAVNEVHMNMMCKLALQAAIRCADKYALQKDETWQCAFDTIIIPEDGEGHLRGYDCASMQAASDQYSPGRANFMFLHAAERYGVLPMEMIETMYFYDEMMRVRIKATPSTPCSEEAPGFTTPGFAAAAAFFGEREKAAQLFDLGIAAYACPPYGNTKEYRKYTDGVYVTNYSAQIIAVLYGFCGLRIEDGEWNVYEASLPKGWEAIEIERVYVGGKAAGLVAKHGQKACLAFESK